MPSTEAASVDPTDFLDDENWHGGYYELAIDLGSRSATSDGRLTAALAVVGGDSRLNGWYADRWSPRDQQPRTATADLDLREPSPLYGVARLPGDVGATVCAIHVIRESAEGTEPPHDWLDLCLPTGALGRADPRVGAYPFRGPEDESLTWRRPIDAWLFDVAARVFLASAFAMALIGHEVSGDPASLDPLAPIPLDRWVGYAVPQQGQLTIHPATH